MNATDALTYPEPGRVILRKDESQRIPNSAKAARPFQYLASPGSGIDHSGIRSVAAAARDKPAVRK
jgi:hypothetical protein